MSKKVYPGYGMKRYRYKGKIYYGSNKAQVAMRIKLKPYGKQRMITEIVKLKWKHWTNTGACK